MKTNPIQHSYLKTLHDERQNHIDALGRSETLSKLAKQFIIDTAENKYTYNFDWLGRPIIQFPQDIVALQEIVWRVQPDLIIETGIAHGGSLILSASLLLLLDACEAIQNNKPIENKTLQRKVVGIDIEIRPHNRHAIENHPLASRIQMIEGSSICEHVIKQVRQIASNYRKILVLLDSNHTHDHVLSELKAYGPLVSRGSYCIVFDTIVEDMPKSCFPDRPWGPGNNPKTAVFEFVKENPDFIIDKSIDHKLLISVAPDGYLLRCG